MSLRCVSLTLLLLVAGAAAPGAKDRIFVDQLGPTRSVLYVANTDGSAPRKLVAGSHLDYNASFSSDGEWVVFTSERFGSADIFRVRPDGLGLERLTDDPAFDDQAALSPDGRQLAFVSTRERGSTDIHILDLETREVRNLTDAAGGDFRPSWSPDGTMLAFSSDRGSGFPKAVGYWEHVHAASVYIVGADGNGLRRISAAGQLGGSPKWSGDGRRVVFYELDVADTFAARTLRHQSTVHSRIVSVDIAAGGRTEHAAGPGLKLSPQFLGPDRVGYLLKSGPTAKLMFSSGESGSEGDIGNPSWSSDGRRVVYHQGASATMRTPRVIGEALSSHDPSYELVYAAGFPAVSPDGRRLVVSERTEWGHPDDQTQLAIWNADGTNPRRIFRAAGSVLAPRWSADGQWIVFGVGGFETRPREAQGAVAFLPSFVGRVMMVRPDGGDARVLATGEGNAGFPNFSPDGTEVVYRFWNDTEGGLRILNLADGTVRTLTTGYDNFPGWSPRGDRIVFSRLVDDDFDIYTIRPDGSGLARLTTTAGNDSHPSWSADGQHILFSSSRLGFKDEAPLTDLPQPYGELFVMRSDGSGQRSLTDTRWEEGTPAWQPAAPR